MWFHIFRRAIKNVCLVFQDVCGAADSRQQPVDVGGAGRLRLLQTVLAHHNGAQGGQIYPLTNLPCLGEKDVALEKKLKLVPAAHLYYFFDRVPINSDVAAARLR